MTTASAWVLRVSATLIYWPGHKRRSLLLNSSFSLIVPVERSTDLSTKVRLPSPRRRGPLAPPLPPRRHQHGSCHIVLARRIAFLRGPRNAALAHAHSVAGRYPAPRLPLPVSMSPRADGDRW